MTVRMPEADRERIKHAIVAGKNDKEAAALCGVATSTARLIRLELGTEPPKGVITDGDVLRMAWVL